jgi:hypothetical protein
VSITITLEGLDNLEAGLGRITPSARRRIVGGALRAAAEAVQQEGNRRIHSPQGRARTFHVIVQGARAYVGPGSRANFFSQRFMPVLAAAISAAHSRIENVIRDAVEAGIRDAFRS